MKNKNINSIKLNKFSFLALLDGLDTFLNLSIITYLAFFFFENIDTRTSILITTSLVLISFFSRMNVFCLVEKILSKFNRDHFNIYLLFSLFYILPIFLLKDFNLVSIFIFVMCRFTIGNLFFIAKKDYFYREVLNKESYFFIKYVIVFLCGMFVGSIIFVFLNDIFSNSEMNEWAWKLFYLFLFMISLIFSIFIKYTVNLTNFKNLSDTKLQINEIKKKIIFFIKNFTLVIPFYLFFIFSCSNWLPRFSNPENMQILDYGMIYVIFIFILTLFIFPLFNLIGKRKLINFVYFLIICISVCAFAFEYSSSYSIDFLKFYLSMIGSFLISLNFLNLKQLNEKSLNTYLSSMSLNFMCLSIITPLSFYFFINFSISYNIIYLVISLFFIISFLAGKYDER